ncbi:MAG: DUF2752 domain-containing protein, partial [Candidatus Solibacter usitatus]|nr:DUF2752 domain-containing protein [Candidatus Solibacter usitatus]
MPPAMVWNSLRAAAGLWLLALGMLPTAAIAQGPSVCLIRRLIGIECFGCGMTRAVSALLHGD